MFQKNHRREEKVKKKESGRGKAERDWGTWEGGGQTARWHPQTITWAPSETDREPIVGGGVDQSLLGAN